MKKLFLDFRLIVGFLLAHVLIYFSFHDKSIFWYIFSGSILILIAYAMYQGEVDDQLSFFRYFLYGLVSGILLYFIFWLGIKVMHIMDIPIAKEIRRLYKWYAPSIFWEYLALILVAAPGEELFWRGFIQKKIMSYTKPVWGIIIGSVLYTSVHVYSGSLLLMLAALLSGLAWGFLYYWKKSMPLVIVSHIIFDIMIFILLPLK
ncbi:CPBP family intramembrane glutamic endopeptidase [Neobacillus dielmonensis]|uniref:CPBP family intramembrane glutamic endopeptidase n=1 Tax=Neobacillus dielmonensis TaxID=1347369 RepID=UPI0005AB1DBD|nr:type II CAAX endopeptidase family protein [Neobacillus dielmonensis]